MATVNEKMTVLADEVRTLSGTTTKKSLDTMTTDINAANTEIAEQTELLEQIVTALEGKASDSGGVTLPTLNNPASASTILNGYEAIDSNGNKITGTIPSKAATTYTPGTSNQTIASGTYLTGTQTIKGDANLIADNIKSGTSIFGVTGTYEGSGGGSSEGSAETCAVTITNYSNEDFNAIITTVIENGQEVPYVLVRNNGDALSNSQTINNLKCGAIIIIVYDVTWSHSSSVIPLTEVDCGANFISISKLNNYGEYVYVFTAPTVANSNSTIICEIEL